MADSARTVFALGACAAATAWALVEALLPEDTAREAFAATPWLAISVAVLAAGVHRSFLPDGDRATGPALPGWLAPAILGALGGLVYASTLGLPWLDPEDPWHLAVVRSFERDGVGPTLASVVAYVAEQPGFLIRSLHLGLWVVAEPVFGDAPAGYRVLVLATHLAAAALLVRLAARLGLAPGASLVAGALFAILPAVRDTVHDPNGLSEVLHGLLYLGALLSWLRRLDAGEGSHPWLPLGLLPLLVLSRDLATSFPLALLGLVAVERGGLRDGWRAFRARGLPTLAVPLAQIGLVGLHFVLDPATTREALPDAPSEFDLYREGLGPLALVVAALRDLPRNLLFPIWDSDPAAWLAPVVAAGAAVWAFVTALGARYRVPAIAGAGVLVLVPGLVALPVLGAEGPSNAHLLHPSAAGLCLGIAALGSGLDRRWLAAAALPLGLWVAFGLHLHVRGMATDREEGALREAGRTLLERIDTDRIGKTVILEGRDDEADRWMTLVLDLFARNGRLGARYVLAESVAESMGRAPSNEVPLVFRWSEAGAVPGPARDHADGSRVISGRTDCARVYPELPAGAGRGRDRALFCLVGEVLDLDPIEDVLRSM